MLRLGHCKNLLPHVHFGWWAWKAKRIQSGIGRACLNETWTGPGPYLDLSSSGPTSCRVSGPHRTGSRRSRVNAKPIWTQSGISPKFIRSRVNGALISVCTKRNNTYKKSAKSSVWKNVKNISSFYSFNKWKLWNRSFGGNLRRLAKIIWGRGDTVSIFGKQVGGVTTRIWNYRKYLGGGREDGLKTRDTACHPPKNSERAPGCQLNDKS